MKLRHKSLVAILSLLLVGVVLLFYSTETILSKRFGPG